MAELDFQRVQAAFAAHIRDPDRQPPPEAIEGRRMAIYRRLFFNNIDNFLSQAFPVLRRLYGDHDWATLVRDFYAHHSCTRPQFYQLAEEFVDYLQHSHHMRAVDPPFMLELAHYEWIELVLAIDPAPMPTEFDPNGNVMEQVCVLSPWLQVLSYDYPVHRIGPDFQPQQPPQTPTCLLVFRQRDEQVGFLELNLVTARFVQMLVESPQSGSQALGRIATELAMPYAQLVEFGRDLLAQLQRRGVILGVEPARS